MGARRPLKADNGEQLCTMGGTGTYIYTHDEQQAAGLIRAWGVLTAARVGNAQTPKVGVRAVTA